MKIILSTALLLIVFASAGKSQNVGIGTSTPQALLDVAGDMRINGLPIGHGAGNGIENVTFGSFCLESNTTGSRLVSIGSGTLRDNVSGSFNVGCGSYCLVNNVTGDRNSAFGDDVMVQNLSGSENTSVGNISLYFNTSGNYNTAVGRGAGISNTTGSGNTFIGRDALPGNGSLSNATAIGNLAVVGASNSMVLGSIYGVNGAGFNTKVGIGTTTPTASLDVVGTLNATAWKTSSMSTQGFADMGGVLLQWGEVDYTSNVAVTITFPQAFTDVYSVTATVDAGINTGSGANVPVKVLAVGNNTFKIAGTIAFSGDATTKILWMAVGR